MPLNVYYLDDEAELCEIFADSFASNEVQVTTFTEASRLVDFVTGQPPDLLFLDYRLLGTTGDAVAQKLNPTYPVILVTGDLSVNSNFKFNRVISKPWIESEVFEIIRSFKRSRWA